MSAHPIEFRGEFIRVLEVIDVPLRWSVMVATVVGVVSRGGTGAPHNFSP